MEMRSTDVSQFLETMRNVDDGDTVVAQRMNDREKLVDLGFRQRARRLSMMRTSELRGEGLAISTICCLETGSLCSMIVGSRRMLRRLRISAASAFIFFSIQRAILGQRLPANENIGRHRQMGEEVELPGR